MDLQVRIIFEFSATNVAAWRGRGRKLQVDILNVGLEVGACGEAVATFVAEQGVRGLGVDQGYMSSQGAGVGESLGAGGAGTSKRPLEHMRAQMFVEFAFRGERFGAEETLPGHGVT